MTLAEQRQQFAAELGRRDFDERRSCFPPVYFDRDEESAYRVGYVRAQRDLLRKWAGKNGGAL